MTMPVRPPLWLLVLVTLSGTLAVHMFVPALTTAAHDLNASAAAIQSTISVYMLGLAIGQLIYGPIADATGRRPALLAGLAVFSLASCVCLFAPSVHLLVIARFMQALGGCSGLLLGRVIVRDTSTAEETASGLAMLSLMSAAGPGLAPIVGGLIVETLGWRWIFVVFIVLGMAGLLLSWRLLPETRPQVGSRSAAEVAVDYFKLLRMPSFIGCVVGGGCSTSVLYAFIAAAPFIFVLRFGESITRVGFYLAAMVVGISVGYIAAVHLARRMRPSTMLLAANSATIACAVALLIQFTVIQGTPISVVATMFLFCIGSGICGPIAMARAMSIDPLVAGSGSGIYGSGQMVIGALCTALGGLGEDRAVSTAIVLLGAAIVGQIGFRVTTRNWVSLQTSSPTATAIT